MKLPAKKKIYGNKRPQIFALCFVKNEDDIVADALLHAAHFCDRIYVVDNNSTDRTWDIVRNIDCDVVVPVGSVDFEYRDYLRTWFMGSRKNELGINNWWYILDADTFLYGDLIDTIQLAEEEGADTIAANVVNFHITSQEKEDADRNNRIDSWRDRRYYHLYESGEVNIFKNTVYLDYGICDRVPLGLIKECSRRLTLRHYPFRSLEQVRKRIQTRCDNREFTSEYKRGRELDSYFIESSLPQLKCLRDDNELDYSGGFFRVIPRIGSRPRDRNFKLLARTLYPLGLLHYFYAGFNRYAFRRQHVNPDERAKFLAKFDVSL